jgi:SM-20-related protein
MHSQSVPDKQGLFQDIAEELARRGWCVRGGLLDAGTVASLAEEARTGWLGGQFRGAGTGRSTGRGVRPEIRSDRIHWLDPAETTEAQRSYLEAMDSLRLVLNRELFVGLVSLESHLAVYPPGAFYQRHLDRFSDSDERAISCVFYLNLDWKASAGGQLRIYTGPDDSTDYEDVLPEAGRLAVFRSDTFYHEVLPAERERFSITGWFRRASATPFRI